MSNEHGHEDEGEGEGEDEHEHEHGNEHGDEHGNEHGDEKGGNLFVREGPFKGCRKPEFSESTSRFPVAPRPLPFAPNRARAQ
jgi:hypothetical protein